MFVSTKKQNVASFFNNVEANLREQNKNLSPKVKKVYAICKIKKQPFFNDFRSAIR